MSTRTVERRSASEIEDGTYELQDALNEVGEFAPHVAGYAAAVASVVKERGPDFALRVAIEQTKVAAMKMAEACTRALDAI
jgi:hypothetical protein